MRKLPPKLSKATAYCRAFEKLPIRKILCRQRAKRQMTFRSSLNARRVVSPDNIFTTINFIHAARLSHGCKSALNGISKKRKPALCLLSPSGFFFFFFNSDNKNIFENKIKEERNETKKKYVGERD